MNGRLCGLWLPSLLVLAVAWTGSACCEAGAPTSPREGRGARHWAGGDGPKTLFQWSFAEEPEDEEEEAEEPDTITTDRPDFTEASSTVGRGRVQLETGYTYSRDAGGGTRSDSHSFPEALLRLGVFADWFEFRVAQNYSSGRTVNAFAPASTTRGAEDLYLGVKLALTEQAGVLPEMVLLPQMFVPTGGRGLSAEEVLPGVNWLYGWDLTDTVSLAGSTQVNRILLDDGYSAELAQSATLGYGLTERLGAYTEWFAFFPAGDRPQHFFDGGFTFLVTADIQLDIRAGVGLNDAADDFFAGAGISFRY